MAGFALGAISSLVAFLLVILAVVADAGCVQFFQRLLAGHSGHASLVAGIALGIAMLALERILRILVVIELGGFPVFFGVAALALVAELALVAFFLVILAVARHARRQEILFVQRLCRQMAGIAFHLLVLVEQDILGVLVVIEMYFLPATVVMAGFAFFPVASLVPLRLIVLAVAGITLFRSLLESLVKFEGLVKMAFLAFDIRMFAARQLEFGLFVIEGGFLPVLCVMAAAAIKAELAFVHIVLLMAGVAFGWRLAIFQLGFVATLALGGLVFVFENETGLVVLERILVEDDYLGIAALVVGMAGAALFIL